MRVPDAEVEVFWARTRDARDGLDVLLDAAERERLGALRRADDRARFLVGCALAKLVAGRRLDRSAREIRFDRTCGECGRAHAKPRLAGGGLELSISHSGPYVAVAAATAPVGVDVECASSAVDAVVPDALAAPEAEAVASLPPDERRRAFLVYWTRKEAAAKAVGLGLRVAPHELVVAGPDAEPKILAAPPPLRDVYLADLAPRAAAAAVAVFGGRPRVTEVDGSDLLRRR